MKICKEIKLSQVGDEWLTWREAGIGASESAVLMGALPFKWNDVLELWKLKTKMIESDFTMNEAMQLGKDLEPEARTKYTKATGIKVQAKCFERTDMPFLKASLDGITKNGKHIVEIKCPGLPKWQSAKKGIVVDYYYPQMQQQMAVSEAESCHYWVYRKTEGGILINVPRNQPYIDELERRAKIFWDCVENKKPALPAMLGIDMRKEVDPFQAGDMETEVLGIYKN